MKLENQVTSLEISKKLKELDVKQESYFYWIDIVGYENRKVHLGQYPKGWIDKGGTLDSYWGSDDYVSAFTVAELGEMLPDKLHEDWWLMFSFDKGGRKYDVSYVRWNNEGGLNTQWQERGDTEADARGKMLIYLLENKLITL